ncbi:MAG: hypothetical protein H6736_24265 [Alphaproteobacteria bacterium]|nr:hypothetical protein [Alphaproteobacteria bacterium]
MSLPDYYDCDLAPEMALGEHGRALADVAGHWAGGRVVVTVETEVLRVYDVWAGEDEDWVQLQRHAASWVHPDLDGQKRRIRFWVAPLDPEVADELAEAEVEAADLAPYVPVVDGEPPLPDQRGALPSRLMRWVHARGDEIVVAAMLDEWTEAAGEAAALGWMCGLPRGEDLLMAYARSAGAAERVVGHESAFARWLVAELGRRVREGLASRRDAESRRAAVQRLFPALSRLLRAVDPDLELVTSPPAVIGPRERHHWLVDDGLAGRLDNPVVVEGAHRPVFVVRPKLVRAGTVLLEGEAV